MSSGITQSDQTLSQPPFWSVVPNDVDWLAWVAIISIGLSVYLVIFLYALFDRWAEQRAEGTPLARTIPTLLAIALLYEIFPLDHFSILLPFSAILVALMADWRREKGKKQNNSQIQTTTNAEPVKLESETLINEADIARMDKKSADIGQDDNINAEFDSKEATNV